jgi:DNA-binding IclR family transcriptional regulator
VLRQLVDHTRAQGYAFNDGRIVSGMSAVGIAMTDEAKGSPVAALSIAAISSRISSQRQRQIVTLLRSAISELRDRLGKNTVPSPVL